MFKKAFDHLTVHKDTYILIGSGVGGIFGFAGLFSNLYIENKKADADLLQAHTTRDALAFEKYKYIQEQKQKIISFSSGLWPKKESKNEVILDIETLNAELEKYKSPVTASKKAVSTLKEASSFFFDRVI